MHILILFCLCTLCLELVHYYIVFFVFDVSNRVFGAVHNSPSLLLLLSQRPPRPRPHPPKFAAVTMATYIRGFIQLLED